MFRHCLFTYLLPSTLGILFAGLMATKTVEEEAMQSRTDANVIEKSKDEEEERNKFQKLHSSEKSSETEMEHEQLQVLHDKNNLDLAQHLADSHENILTQRELIIVFLSMTIGLFLAFVDQTGITVALPYIADDLKAHQTISWAGTASLISTTVFAILFGRFSDIFSRKYTLIGSMVILAFFDLGCGLAQTPTQFYIFRAFCGIGTGGITSLTMVIVSDIVTLEQRGKYQGILGSFVGLGNAIGPFIASAFIEHLTWRKFYYTLFPIILCATISVFMIVPYTKPDYDIKEKIKNVDYLGFLSSSIAIIFLLIPISGGGSTFDWNSPFTIAMLTIGGAFVFVFLFVEYKIARLPMVPLRLFSANLSLTVLLSQNFFFGICYFSAIYYYPYYFEVVRNYSVLHTSCFFLAMVVPQCLSSISAGQLISRTKHYWHVTWFGYCMWMLALGLLNLWSSTNNYGLNIITMIINGMGVGCIFQPTLVAAQAHSYKKDRATVISTRNLLRSLGGAISLAISSTIVANTISRQLNISGNKYFSNEEIKQLKTLVYSKIDLTLYTAEQAEYLRGLYMKSIKTIFYVWMGCMGYCLVTNLSIKDRGLKPVDDRGD